MGFEDSHTWRYLQNLTCFLVRPEVHHIHDNEKNSKKYRPNGINFDINYSFLKKELDIVYMIDITCAMTSWIMTVKNNCNKIFDNLKKNKILKNYDIQFGGVFYLDSVDSIDDYHEFQPLGNVYDLKERMNFIICEGGGDVPEDWIGAYEIALNKMKWRKESIKIIIHIADAGAHHFRFSDEDKISNDYKYEIGLVNSIKKCANKKINILGYQVAPFAEKSFKECKSIYDSFKSNDSIFEIYKFEYLSEKERDFIIKEDSVKHILTLIKKNN